MAIETEVTINWTNENNDIAETYEIHRSQTSGFTPSASTKVAETLSSVNEFTEKLADGTYYYKIKVINEHNTRVSSETEVICDCEANAQPQVVTVSANMFETDADLNNYINDSTNNSSLDTMEDIFNTWPRVTNRTFYTGPSDPAIDSESSAWYFDSTKNSFVYPNNESNTTMIVSPNEVGDLTINGVLTSDSTDDDGVGIIVAAKNTSTSFRFVALWIRPHGSTGGTPNTVALRYGYEGNGGYGDILDSNNFLSENNWNGKKVKFQITKTNNIITAKVSDYDGTVVDDASEVTADLNNIPNIGNALTGTGRYGFGVYSQKETYFENVSFISNTQANNIAYSAESNTKYQYQSTGWANVGTASDDFGGVDIINNNDTGKSFAFDGNTTFTKI